MRLQALIASLLLAAAAPARADLYETKLCNYNGRNPMAVSLAWNAYGFSVRWADGVGNRYTYGPGPALVTDQIGGQWIYRGEGRFFSLVNPANGNQIICM
jgi:hypothetical protein